MLQSRVAGTPFYVPVMMAALAMGPLLAWAIAGEYWRSLVLVCLVAISPIVVRWPVVVGFGAFALVLPFDSVSVIADTGGATATKFVGIAVTGALLLTGIIQRRLVRPPLVALWVTVLVFWAVLSLAWAADVDRARTPAMTAVSLLAMYLVAASYTVSEAELTTVCWLALIGGALAAAGGVVLGFDPDSGQTGRGTLSLGESSANPNAVAQSLLLPFAIGIGMFSGSRRTWTTVVAGVGIAAIAAGIFLTMSRGSLFAVAVTICVCLYRYRARPRVLVVVAILAALLPAMPDLFFHRAESVFTGEDATGAGRTEIWKIGVHSLDRFSVIGVGFANFAAAYDQYAYPAFGRSRVAHNMYLSTWVELGIVGLVLLALVLRGHWRLTKHAKIPSSQVPLAPALEAACIGFAVVGFFGDALWDKMFWTQWILIIWLSRTRHDRLISESSARGTLAGLATHG